MPCAKMTRLSQFLTKLIRYSLAYGLPVAALLAVPASVSAQTVDACSVHLVFEDSRYGGIGGSDISGIPVEAAHVEFNHYRKDSGIQKSAFEVGISSSFESGLSAGLLIKRYIYDFELLDWNGRKASEVFGSYCGSQIGLHIVGGAKRIHLQNEFGVRISYILPSVGLCVDLSSRCLNIEPREPLTVDERETVLQKVRCEPDAKKN